MALGEGEFLAENPAGDLGMSVKGPLHLGVGPASAAKYPGAQQPGE